MIRQTFATAVLGLGLVQLAPAHAGTLTTLHSFNTNKAFNPSSGLIADSSGTLYGTTLFGRDFPADDYGAVFSLSTAGTLTILAHFNGSNGIRPSGGLIADAAGTLYGTTPAGGSGVCSGSGCGTVFSLTSGGTLTTLASFNGTNGTSPRAGVIADASGTLYGTTIGGGAGGKGTVFSLTSGGTLTTLASFNGTNGASPIAGLIADASGTLYGTTLSGGDFGANCGIYGCGTVFSLTSSGTLSTLVAFDGTNGVTPYGGLIADASGTLYGTTSGGGAYGGGTVFSLTTTGTLTTLASFNGTNGAGPFAGLIADASGTLYGTTRFGGGLGYGTVFSLTTTGTLTTLASFKGTNGAAPEAGLVMDASGKLYGTTFFGGVDAYGQETNSGTVFSLTTSNSTVPEPASWALLITGFGLTGAAMRRRNLAAVTA